MNKDNWKLQVW